MNNQKISVLLLVSVLVISLSAFGVLAQDDEEPIKVGSVWSLTGTAAPLGQAQLEGSELAVELENEDGGIMGHEIEYTNIDGESNTSVISTAAQRLTESFKAVAAIGGEDDSLTSAMGPIFQENKVPYVIGSATTPTQPRMGDYVFMTAFGDNEQGRAAAKYMVDELGWEKIAVMWDNASAYSTILSRQLKDAFREITGDPKSIVAEEIYQTGDKNYQAQLTRLNLTQEEIDGLVVTPPFPQDGPVILQQARELGLEMPMFLTDGADDPSLVEVGGETVKGVYVSGQFDADKTLTDAAEKFVEAYEEKHGNKPGAFEAVGYDNMRIVLEAVSTVMKQEGEEAWNNMSLSEKRSMIRDTIQQHDFTTTTVPVSYPDPAEAIYPRVPLKSVFIKQVQEVNDHLERVYIDHLTPEEFMN